MGRQPARTGAATTWAMIAAGDHSMAIQTNGTLWGWGYNLYGQVGDGTTVNVTTGPKQIGLGTTWSVVSSGSGHSIATQTNGTLWGWGYNALYGSVGDGTAVRTSRPRCGSDKPAGRPTICPKCGCSGLALPPGPPPERTAGGIFQTGRNPPWVCPYPTQTVPPHPYTQTFGCP